MGLESSCDATQARAGKLPHEGKMTVVVMVTISSRCWDMYHLSMFPGLSIGVFPCRTCHRRYHIKNGCHLELSNRQKIVQLHG